MSDLFGNGGSSTASFKTVKLNPHNPLFDVYYHVSLTYAHLYTLDEIRHYGLRQPGDSDEEEFMPTKKIRAQMSISMMFEKWKEGATVFVASKADTREIYEAIQHHIRLWVDRMRSSVNNGKAPVEELILLDKFAGTVYEHAKYIFKQNVRELASIKPFLDDGFDFTTFLNDKPEAQVDKLDKHNSFAEILKDRYKTIRSNHGG